MNTAMILQSRALLRMIAALVLGGTTILAAADPSLYERLGGHAVMDHVAFETLERAAHDPRTMRSFKGFKLLAIQQSLAQQLCAVSDGHCVYEGDTMAVAHKDLHIQPSEFDALVTILREEMDRAGVAAGPKNELLRRLAPMRRDIVAPAK